MTRVLALCFLMMLQSPAGRGTIEGKVTIDGTDTPIPNAVVTLVTPGATARNPEAITDGSGRFSFHDLQAGSYFLVSRAEGYTRPYRSASTKDVTVKGDGPPANGDMTLARTASIRGRVTRGNQAPVASVAVAAIPALYVGSQQIWLSASSAYGSRGALTNSEGEYEIVDLPPMEYFIVAARPGTSWRPYGTYYPSSIHPSDAKSIIVKSGGEAVADIEWQDVPRYKVSGTVLPELSHDATTPLAALYIIYRDTRVRDDVPPDDIPSPSRISTGVPQTETNMPATFRGGQFEIRDVRPGSYDVIAVVGSGETRFSGSATVEVIDRDIEGVVVGTHPGVTVKANVPFSIMPIGTTPYLGSSMKMVDNYAEVGGQAVYSIRNVPEGTYAVLALGGVATDVQQNGRSIYDTGLVIGAAAPAPLEILTARVPGSLHGVVQSADRRAARYAWISLVPSPPHRTNPALYKTVRADANGRFEMTGLVPGDYKVFAFDEIPYNAAANPLFISRFESFGIGIRIGEGQNSQLSPPLVSMP